ncbi:HIT family protein [Chitinimonas sp. BJB300]|uniref:HIT family protein n=1 Tax=Chitinimonas sp. BJB300 TaxID=1559339 RepID=UPI000C0C9D77|nr:HIT family protein [Chitinimonas sp. BJB300]PHV11298.1 HIT family protein [Chitinimonas sp. BJB300]TSJ91569.1 HIT family protein [Chitinimonas sp. BJB300]
MTSNSCPLCNEIGGELIWQSALYRVVMVEELGYPGFCRVILNHHVAEMTELGMDERNNLMNAVWAVEEVLRVEMKPQKVNLASLGNVVPHLHWHVIPRWQDDPHFPAPIWATPLRESTSRTIDLNWLKAALASKLLMLESFSKE